MNNLNQIEEQIKKKSEQELTNLVENFIREVKKFEDKYGGGNWYNLGEEITHHSHYSASHMSSVRFKEAMMKCMKEKFIERMVKVKSKELLDKLELI